MSDDLAATRVLAATILVNLGLAGLVGGWASALWLRRARSPWAAGSHRRCSAALTLALAFTAAADGLLLWFQAAYLAEVSLADALVVLPSMLLQTYAGHAWSGGVVGLLLVLAASRGATRLPGRMAAVATAVGIGAFVYSRVAVSHAGDFGLGSLQLLVEYAHLCAIALWLGVVGVAAFGVVSDRVPTTADGRADLARWLRSLSSAATGALVVVAGTGFFNGWRSLGSPADLVASPYGNALLVKVGLVAVAVALGAINRFHGLPRVLIALRTPRGPAAQPLRRFVQVLRIEAAVLLAALVAAAVLSTSPLPHAT